MISAPGSMEVLMLDIPLSKMDKNMLSILFQALLSQNRPKTYSVMDVLLTFLECSNNSLSLIRRISHMMVECLFQTELILSQTIRLKRTLLMNLNKILEPPKRVLDQLMQLKFKDMVSELEICSTGTVSCKSTNVWDHFTPNVQTKASKGN